MHENGNTEKSKAITEAAVAASKAEITGRARPYREIRKLHRQLDGIRTAYKKLVYSREQATHAYEWLFDNYYILEREGRQVIKQLWKTCPLPMAGRETAVRLHTGKLCEAAAGHIDAEAIEQYIENAQLVRCFESSELSAFGLMLRAALIDGAARACTLQMDEAKRLLLLSDAIKTLNFLTTFDFSQIVERQSRLEQILSKDPANVYTKMDERSRSLYRERISQIAIKRKISEIDAAKQVIALAEKGVTPRERHVGHYILDNEIDKPYVSKRGKIYLTLLWIVPTIISVALWALFGARLSILWLPFLLFFPIWEIIRPVTDYLILKGVPATFLPRLELEGEIPEEAPTLVVVSVLLTTPQKAEEFAKKLERFYYSNGRGNITFGILADLKEAKLPELPEDKAVRAAAVKAVKKLNHKYGSHFCLFIRGRRFSSTQGKFSGWERKRGAIIELVRMIKGRQTSITAFEGDLECLRSIKYIITIDADTGLVMDTAAEMVAVAMHPLNAPQVENGIVTHGFGILAPRIGVDLESAAITPFSRIMAGCGGVTAYDNASGDTYQDIFGEGIYAGKGIINVDTFYEVLDNALPENLILSHDILEGCYMRAGFLSDVELTDGFPPSPIPWFDRLHRWIRGDWQNIGFIKKKLPDGNRNPFNTLCRFKLTDNIRRALTPVLSFLCLVAAAFLPLGLSIMLIAVSFLSLSGAGLWSAALAVAHGGPSMLSRKYHCRVMPQAVNSIAQGVLGYLFLPHHAFVAADAAIRSLYRRRSGKKLLEWMTAAESESQKKVRSNGFFAIINRFWDCLIFGIVFLILAPSPAAKIAGTFFVITPFVAWLSGRVTPPIRDDLTDEESERLRSYSAAMWRYYEDYVTAKENFLPPDNVQEAPVSVIAHRTSPTNIGLMLLSTLSAHDMKLIDLETMFERINATFSTMERMVKWKGHLYNWYDTRTLAPLHPAYVSTVDSGNMLCCLVALREGLLEYRHEYDGCLELCERITKFIDDTDLSALYNRHRRLFHIGYDLEKGELTEIYYDLLMSEARLTSYYAVAKRIAPKRHWGALGRTLTRQNGYTGPVSWTGTMFEYLMPHLLLPVFEDSMAAETLRFVIYCQKRRVKERGVPWGISESGFYSFDAALNYQYEAHGVQKLALKRGMDDTLVISPYSTFLALPFDRQDGMKNLEALENLGMYGRCGFFEAADFTYKRTGGQMAAVKSYMAHHIGMSIVAADNALNDGIMQERFLRDHEMRAAQDLLREKIPADAVVFNDVLLREMPEKPGRYGITREEFEVTSPVTPRVSAVSNGEYTMLLTDCGVSLSMFRGLDVTRRSPDILRAPTGIFAAASFGGNVITTAAAPKYEESRVIKRKVEFNTHGAVYHARCGSFGIDMQAILHSGMPCEVRRVDIENFSQRRVNTKLLFYFEPALAKAADEAAHPAFSRLFLHADYRPDTKMLIYSRRPRGSDLPASIAVGFAEIDVDFEFDSDRENLLIRPLGISSIEHALDVPYSNRTGAIPDAAAAIRLHTELGPHAKKSITLLIAAANTPEEASARLIEARRQGFHGIMRNAAGKESGEMESRLAALVLPQILFPVRDGKEVNDAVHRNRLGQSGLWGLGISGDFPIILFNYQNVPDLERLEPYIKMHRALRLKGIQFDLVITYREGGDYSQTILNTVKRCVRRAGCEYLIGSRAGIHVVNLGMHPEETRLLLLSSACHIADGTMKGFNVAPFSAQQLRTTNPLNTEIGQAKTYGGWFSDNKYVISHSGENPPAPWCHILATDTFGTLLSDRALGFTWAINARENKLTPWTNDPVSDNRGEMLLVKLGSNVYDICLNARVTYEPRCAVYESETQGIVFRVKVTIGDDIMAKKITLEISNERDSDLNIEVAYYTEPILGVGPSTRRHIVISRLNGAAMLRNPWSQVTGCAFLTALDGMDRFIYNRANFLAGKWENGDSAVSPDPCAAAVVKRHLPPRRSEKINFVLGFAGSEEAADKMLERIKNHNLDVTEPQNAAAIQIKTPDAQLDALVNTWLSTQFMGSRIKGRTGFYQCGGAFGFRDQLQDCCAAIFVEPKLTKAHIYRSAAHQFKEGDVMHWWHQLPPRDGGSKGVRTRCSDDMLWLPYTVCEYLEKTGDYSIFDHEVYYLEGAELDPTEEDRYFVPARSNEKENVYGHCIRAINKALTHGSHGLPLFGSGDWNDGMNLVGIGGSGESVWLAMFEVHVLERFARVAKHMNDDAHAAQYLEEAEKLRKAVDETCWNGAWYARGFYDDGHPLGVKENSECRIDILPQSFSVIANMPDEERRKKALDSMMNILVDDRLRVVHLFDPPFDKASHNPGYIRSYPPGIRENGGQYTHAAVWGALAMLIEKRPDDAYKILSYINPAHRAQSYESAQTYRLEPYAITADIYTNPSCEGRGGWSLYTGAAGWYYRTVVEYLLGIKVRAKEIFLSPCLPTAWPGYEAQINLHGTSIKIKVERGENKGLTVDNRPLESILLDQKEHEAKLVI